MSLTNPFAKHQQPVYRERAGDIGLPLWLRVSFLAWGCHRQNGHANFQPGEISELLGKPADQISRALRQAKEKGYIAAESTPRCLVVPAHAISGGLGNENDVCAVHTGKRTGRKPIVFNPPKFRAVFTEPVELVEQEETNALPYART